MVKSRCLLPGMIFLFLLMHASCNRKVVDECAVFSSLAAATSSPVDAGGTLQLQAPAVPYAQTYSWTGPNGFTSYEQNPVVNNVQSANAGKYSVRIKTPGCTGVVYTDSVVVRVASAPCSVTNNTAAISGAISLQFSNPVGAVGGGSYFLTASADRGDIEIEFAGARRPSAGVYPIRSLGGEWVAGRDVRLRIIALSSNWPSSSGMVYVTEENKKLSATFCNVPVSSQTFTNLKSTASGKVTEK